MVSLLMKMPDHMEKLAGEILMHKQEAQEGRLSGLHNRGGAPQRKLASPEIRRELPFQPRAILPKRCTLAPGGE